MVKDLSNFVESFSELLIERNLKPTEFAKQIGCGKGTISRYLNGTKIPSVDMLVRMADFFECSTDYVLGLETEKYPRKFHKRPPFQERLPVLCQQLNTKKYRLQKKTNIAESAIYNWQRGDCKPRLENILKIADAFDCSVDFVLGRSDI